MFLLKDGKFVQGADGRLVACSPAGVCLPYAFQIDFDLTMHSRSATTDAGGTPVVTDTTSYEAVGTINSIDLKIVGNQVFFDSRSGVVTESFLAKSGTWGHDSEEIQISAIQTDNLGEEFTGGTLMVVLRPTLSFSIAYGPSLTDGVTPTASFAVAPGGIACDVILDGDNTFKGIAEASSPLVVAPFEGKVDSPVNSNVFSGIGAWNGHGSVDQRQSVTIADYSVPTTFTLSATPPSPSGQPFHFFDAWLTGTVTVTPLFDVCLQPVITALDPCFPSSGSGSGTGSGSGSGCLPDGSPCSSDADCCNGTCSNGQCGPGAPCTCPDGLPTSYTPSISDFGTCFPDAIPAVTGAGTGCIWSASAGMSTLVQLQLGTIEPCGWIWTMRNITNGAFVTYINFGGATPADGSFILQTPLGPCPDLPISFFVS